jgi:hypothetical protein
MSISKGAMLAQEQHIVNNPYKLFNQMLGRVTGGDPVEWSGGLPEEIDYKALLDGLIAAGGGGNSVGTDMFQLESIGLINLDGHDVNNKLWVEFSEPFDDIPVPVLTIIDIPFEHIIISDVSYEGFSIHAISGSGFVSLLACTPGAHDLPGGVRVQAGYGPPQLNGEGSLIHLFGDDLISLHTTCHNVFDGENEGSRYAIAARAVGGPTHSKRFYNYPHSNTKLMVENSNTTLPVFFGITPTEGPPSDQYSEISREEGRFIGNLYYEAGTAPRVIGNVTERIHYNPFPDLPTTLLTGETQKNNIPITEAEAHYSGATESKINTIRMGSIESYTGYDYVSIELGRANVPNATRLDKRVA